MPDVERLHLLLQSSRELSIQEVDSGFYPHADRGLAFYRALIPRLDEIVLLLAKRNDRIKCLDAGCGTSRGIAELADAYRGLLDPYGITLSRYPPLMNAACLPDDKLLETSIRDAPFVPGEFTLTLAVGSIDTSNTVVSEGSKLLELTAKGGVFIFAPTTSGAYDSDCIALAARAAGLGFHTELEHSSYRLPVFYFFNTQ